MDKLVVKYRIVIEELEKELKNLQKERKDLELSVATYKQKSISSLLLGFVIERG